MAGIQTSQSPIISNKKLAVNDVKSKITAIRQAGGALAANTADAFDAITDATNAMLKVLKTPPPSLNELIVTDTAGNVIAWAGSRVYKTVNYEGVYAKQLYVGGTDPSNAPLFADNAGNVVIGLNGSVAIQDLAGTFVGFLGVVAQAPVNIIGVTNAAGLIQIETSAPHNYVTGDTVSVLAVPGVTSANGDHVITVVDATHFTENGSAFSGAYTSGGTVARFYGGVWSQSAAFGGTGFADANIRIFADGHIGMNGLIDFNQGGISIAEVLIGGGFGIEVIQTDGTGARTAKMSVIGDTQIFITDGTLTTAIQPNIIVTKALTASGVITFGGGALTVDASGNLASSGSGSFGSGALTVDTSGNLVSSGAVKFSALASGVVYSAAGVLTTTPVPLGLGIGGTGATTATTARASLSAVQKQLISITATAVLGAAGATYNQAYVQSLATLLTAIEADLQTIKTAINT